MANVNLSWQNNDASGDSIVVQRDGADVAYLNPLATGHTDVAVPAGIHEYRVAAGRGAERAFSAPVTVNVLAAPSSLSAVIEY